jgi:hypothetical protein
MITIDTINPDTGFPDSFDATRLFPVRHYIYDNSDNEELSEKERETPTGTEYLVVATTYRNGYLEEVAVDTYDIPEEAVAAYDRAISQMIDGRTVIRFRNIGEGLGNDSSKASDGDSAQDRQPGEVDALDGLPKIL